MMVADTDVLIDALSGVEPSRNVINLELATGRLATTVVTAFELLSGARRSSQRTRIEQLLTALIILPLELKAGRIAAQVRRKLESKGKGIGMADYLIAGICLSRNAILLTRNQAHFRRVPGLHLAPMRAPQTTRKRPRNT